MKPDKNGNALPDLVKESQETEEVKVKTRTFKNRDGTITTITEDDFAKVIEIYRDLQKLRDKKTA